MVEHGHIVPCMTAAGPGGTPLSHRSPGIFRQHAECHLVLPSKLVGVSLGKTSGTLLLQEQHPDLERLVSLFTEAVPPKARNRVDGGIESLSLDWSSSSRDGCSGGCIAHRHYSLSCQW